MSFFFPRGAFSTPLWPRTDFSTPGPHTFPGSKPFPSVGVFQRVTEQVFSPSRFPGPVGFADLFGRFFSLLVSPPRLELSKRFLFFGGGVEAPPLACCRLTFPPSPATSFQAKRPLFFFFFYIVEKPPSLPSQAAGSSLFPLGISWPHICPFGARGAEGLPGHHLFSPPFRLFNEPCKFFSPWSDCPFWDPDPGLPFPFFAVVSTKRRAFPAFAILRARRFPFCSLFFYKWGRRFFMFGAQGRLFPSASTSTRPFSFFFFLTTPFCCC